MPENPFDFPPIEDYAVLGNGHSAALVSRSGSIDWWSPMRFDRPPVFAALLDAAKGGRFLIAPVEAYRAERRYLDRTNVLETTFTTHSGRVRVTDFMPLDDPGGVLRLYHGILRSVECTAGEAEIQVLYEPRFAYGGIAARIRPRGALGYWCVHGTEALALRSEAPLDVSSDGARAEGRIVLRQGERCWLGLSYARDEPLVLPPLGDEAAALAERTVRWWERWIAQCTYDGPYRDAVLRSALALRLMIYAPSGAIVAAPTTSLPEHIGGERNWDYRYCWLRDAGMSMRALMGLGYRHEAAAYFGWLTHATNLTWPRLNVLYDLFGGSRMEEVQIEHLSGYRGSRPVRVGNGAATQLQLDVYGEVIGAAHEYIKRGGEMGRRDIRKLLKLGYAVCDLWGRPDSGIWEPRSAPLNHVYSKVMCWRVVDSLLKLHETGHLEVPVERFTSVRDDIRSAVEKDGYKTELNSYTQAFENETADASLLLLPMQGYVDPGAPRMRSTYTYLKEHLCRDGLWFRYPPGMDDGLPGAEGAFGVCSFWAAEYLARRGDLGEATETFERMLAAANDVGLFAEEVDPATGAALGNFPQAFTHIGLINAALAIAGEGRPEPVRSHRPSSSRIT